MYTISKPRGPWQTASLTRDGSRIREIVIRIEPGCLAIKTKGTRTWFRLPYAVIFDKAIMAAVLAARAEKQKAKTPRRRAVRRGVIA